MINMDWMGETPHLLLVDDERSIREPLAAYLTKQGFRVTQAGDAEQARARLAAYAIDLVVLDIMMPGEDGLSLTRHLRETSELPVILLTARAEETDRIVGLEMGADDYVVKPFSPRELSARMRAILRRGRPAETAEARDGHEAPLSVGNLQLDVSARYVSTDGRRIDLTTMEYDLLEALMRSPGAIFSREKLMQQVFKRSFSPFDRSLDVHISNLRHKIGPYPDGSDRIKTVRGVGYILSYPPEEARGG